MGRLFIQIAVSLDGYIEDRNGDIDWMVDDGSTDAAHTATLQGIDGMVFGRKAHALLSRYWPTAAAATDASAERKEQARLMNALPKYVLTHQALQVDWSNSQAIRLDEVAKLKDDAPRAIAVFAGAAAIQAVLAAGWIDEIRIIRYPVLLGSGTPVFADAAPRRELRALSSERFSSGAVLDRFEVLEHGMEATR